MATGGGPFKRRLKHTLHGESRRKYTERRLNDSTARAARLVPGSHLEPLHAALATERLASAAAAGVAVDPAMGNTVILQSAIPQGSAD